MLDSFDHVTRRLIVHASPTKRTSDFVAHLEHLDPFQWFQARPAYQAGGTGSGQWSHPHKQTLPRSACLPAHWLTVEWLPKYAPELNDIEGVWRDLMAHHLAHQTFADADALNTAIHQAVDALNLERTRFRWSSCESLLSVYWRLLTFMGVLLAFMRVLSYLLHQHARDGCSWSGDSCLMPRAITRN